MGDYLTHWWNGDLTQFYLWGLSISQLNKVMKVGILVSGALAIFEFIRFTTLMHEASFVARFSLFVWRLVADLANLPNNALGLLIGLILAWRRKLPIKEVMRNTAIEYLLRSYKSAKSDPLVQILLWLERHPVSEQTIKKLAFAALFIFTLGELLTS